MHVAEHGREHCADRLNEAAMSDPANDVAKMRPDDDGNGQDEE
jgi:hypothetical protein